MRITASWLLALSIALLFADAYTAARMTKDCCCAGMANSCPLKQASHRACDHNRTCSIERSDAGTAEQYLRSEVTREPSTLTGYHFQVRTPSVAWLVTSSSEAHPIALNTSPEIPPPRSA